MSTANPCAKPIGRATQASPLYVAEPADEVLMQRAQQGDRGAFEHLVHRHIDALFRYAQRLSGSAHKAEDLVQETWLAAWHARGRYRPAKASLSTWLHRILHNKYIDASRKDRLRYDNDQVDQAADAQNPNSTVARSEQLRLLNRAIESLPLQQKSAILLTHQQGFSNRQVAQIMGLKVRALESLLARARRALSAQIASPNNVNEKGQ